MSLFEGQTTKAEPVVSCAVCGKPALWMVWEADLCATCHAAWFSDPRFEAGRIYAALGLNDPQDQLGDEAHRAYCAEATKRTRAWVAARKARAA